MIPLAANPDPLIPLISILAVLFIGIGLFLKKIKQPYIIGYILIGALVGKDALGLIDQTESVHRLGEIGIILLLFFIGMEISLPDLVKQWKVAVMGTFLQVLISVAFMAGIGWFLDWHLNRSIILGFVVAISSSAVIIKILDDKGLMNSNIGKNVLSILLMQDIIVVPLLIISSFLGGVSESFESIVLMLVGGLLMVGILVYIYIKRVIELPFAKQMAADNELQVFSAIFYCFGGALLSSLFGISAALGAFVGGMLMHASQATDWISNTLHSFRILFVAIFFISVGLQIDFTFIRDHLSELLFVVFIVFLLNHLINGVILRFFGSSWRDSILGGAFLAQIGEMSFLLAFSAYKTGIINDFGYNFSISLISMTLVVSPFWISLTEYLLQRYLSNRNSKALT